MTESNPTNQNPSVTRRDFLKTSAAMSAAAALSTGLSRVAYAQGSDEIRVGLIGCGGRGGGAMVNAYNAADNVKLVAMGDVFEDRLQGTHNNLIGRLGDAVDVPQERRFVGFDAYQKVMETDCNYVILAAPPGFRPEHVRAAVEADKHIFAEKPVAVDPAGGRLMLQMADKIDEKGLCFTAGTQRRHERIYQDTIARLHDGAIGDIIAAQCYWNQGGVWNRLRQDGWTDMEWQIRNFPYFTWLSGDHLVEQHIHNIDVINWALGEHPVRALGMGGRQVRTSDAYGHIFDHFTIEFEYSGGQRLLSMCRQIDGCTNKIGEFIQGTKGTSDPERGRIEGEQNWRFRGEHTNGFVEEHRVLIDAIRNGGHVNEAHAVTQSTLSAVMGRMSAYTGQALTWDQMLETDLDLLPGDLSFGDLAMPKVAVPGQTSLTDTGWG